MPCRKFCAQPPRPHPLQSPRTVRAAARFPPRYAKEQAAAAEAAAADAAESLAQLQLDEQEGASGGWRQAVAGGDRQPESSSVTDHSEL